MAHTRTYVATGENVSVRYAEHGDQLFYIKTCDGPIEAELEARRFQKRWDNLVNCIFDTDPEDDAEPTWA